MLFDDGDEGSTDSDMLFEKNRCWHYVGVKRNKVIDPSDGKYCVCTSESKVVGNLRGPQF